MNNLNSILLTALKQQEHGVNMSGKVEKGRKRDKGGKREQRDEKSGVPGA